MKRRKRTCILSLSLAISLLFLCPVHTIAQNEESQPKRTGKTPVKVTESLPNKTGKRSVKVSDFDAKDSVSWFNGIAVSIDAVGLLQLGLSDYGQYEAALRIHVKDRYFPILELGYGQASHDDDVTLLSYRSKAPYGRIGLDINVLKNKFDDYRVYAGLRYAFTSFKYDLWHPGVEDPFWGGTSEYSAYGVKCHQHWAELVFGVDAKIIGPVHLGWSLRYRRRLSSDEGPLGNAWYVPGYGLSDSSNLGGTFNVIFEI